jgi:methionine sulfoxide reductase heme-binding subunit
MSYGLAVLGLVHYFLQSKIDVFAATYMAGLFVLAMVLRFMVSRRMTLTPKNVALAGIIATILTAIMELLWYHFETGVNAMRVFMANFNIAHGLRPAGIILLAGLAITAVTFLRAYSTNRRSASR